VIGLGVIAYPYVMQQVYKGEVERIIVDFRAE